MSAVNEWVVREYFELMGFLVSQPRKYAVSARQKKPDEEVDLVVMNPNVKDHELPDHLVWTSRDLKHVARAVVGIRGWHTDRFYASTFEQTPDILRFAEPASIGFATRSLGSGDMARILCLPKLPASGALKKKTIDALRAKGINGVFSFRTILSELILRVDAKRNYEKSDLLQIIRLLKNYELVRDSQLELFGKKKRRSKAT